METIICVDDEKIVLTAIKSQLSRHLGDDVNIEIAESGAEALDIIDDILKSKDSLPVVIVDQIMPGMKGDQLLVNIHKLLPKTLKILLTGQADANAVGNALNNANLYRYFSKPWDETDLVMTVKEAIRSFHQDKKLEQQNVELVELNKNLEYKVKERTLELYKQKEIIEEKNYQLEASISTAYRIQRALFPSREYINQFIQNYFILYKPKDIVSGDFYWFKQIRNYIVVAAVDCTGHGVPGAFMSALGISFLNNIMAKSTIESPAVTLNHLRENIKSSLNQDNINELHREGMDIALCIINLENCTLQYSGAFNPLFVIRNGELLEYKGDRQPIGLHPKESEFTNHSINLKNDDLIYLFSDGYSDQLGGEEEQKYKTKNFKKLLLEIHTMSLNDQHDVLEAANLKWRGLHPQTDDILVIGIKI